MIIKIAEMTPCEWVEDCTRDCENCPADEIRVNDARRIIKRDEAVKFWQEYCDDVELEVE